MNIRGETLPKNFCFEIINNYFHRTVSRNCEQIISILSLPYLKLFLSSGNISGFNTSKSVNRLIRDCYTLYIILHPPQFGFDMVKQLELVIDNTCNDL